MKINSKTKKKNYLKPLANAVEMNTEHGVLVGSNEDIGGQDLAPMLPDVPIFPNML